MLILKSDFAEVKLDEDMKMIHEILLIPNEKNCINGTILLGEDGIVDLNIWKSIKNAKTFESNDVIKVLGSNNLRNGKNYLIKRLILPKNIRTVPRGMFTFLTISLTIETLVWPDECHIIMSEGFSGARVSFIENIDHVVSIFQGAFADSYIDGIKWPSKCCRIPENAFRGSSVRCITNTGHVTSIGDKAFFGCYNLKKFTLPQNVKEIPEDCFASSGLREIKGCENVTKIGMGAFSGCSIRCFAWPSGCEIIPFECFRGANNLQTVSNLESVTTVGDFAFSYTSLAELSFSPMLTQIGAYAFWRSTLRNISGIENIEKIGCQAFAGTFIQKFVWPSKCQTIKSGTFMDSMLYKITNLQNVISIENRAFFHSVVAEIDLSDSLCADIDEGAFDGINPQNVKLGYYAQK